MGAGRFCFSVGGVAPGATLVTAVQALRRGGRADDGGMDGGGTPGGSDAKISQFRHQAGPLSLQVIHLDGGERAVEGDPVLC